MTSGHIVIAGTGRAGTSFLIRWLASSGLDAGEWPSGDWIPDADAGMERAFLPPRPGEPPLPRVVKDPWLSTYLDVVDLTVTPIDVLIVPIRRLSSAAASRVRIERLALDRVSPGWLGDVFSSTSGGVVWSMNPVDVERLLAVGFHDLIRWAVENEIELRLLDFPRLLDDVDYLIGRLAEWLPDHDYARREHLRLSKGSAGHD